MTRFLLFLFLFAIGCAPFPKEGEEISLTPVSFDRLPGWKSDNHSAVLPAFKNSCDVFLKKGDLTKVIASGSNAMSAGQVSEWKSLCQVAQRLTEYDTQAVRSFFEAWFQPYRVHGEDGSEGLFTGYYEPELNGSYIASAKFNTPLYRRPYDLIDVNLGDFRDEYKGEKLSGRLSKGKLVPYYTRERIRSGALKGMELLWVDDPVSAFFLQIQGSGRIKMDTGEEVRVGYDGKNGHAYTSIGKVMVEKGWLKKEDVSLQSIRDWLYKNPTQMNQLLNENASFVFFRKIPGDGPIGGQGVPLTPGRSLAVDHTLVPYGVPVWVDIEHPEQNNKLRLRRLMIAQDTGGAIRGAVRGDFFWGHGAVAERFAGKMKSRGSYYILLPKTKDQKL